MTQPHLVPVRHAKHGNCGTDVLTDQALGAVFAGARQVVRCNADAVLVAFFAAAHSCRARLAVDGGHSTGGHQLRGGLLSFHDAFYGAGILIQDQC